MNSSDNMASRSALWWPCSGSSCARYASKVCSECMWSCLQEILEGVRLFEHMYLYSNTFHFMLTIINWTQPSHSVGNLYQMLYMMGNHSYLYLWMWTVHSECDKMSWEHGLVHSEMRAILLPCDPPLLLYVGTLRCCNIVTGVYHFSKYILTAQS